MTPPSMILLFSILLGISVVGLVVNFMRVFGNMHHHEKLNGTAMAIHALAGFAVVMNFLGLVGGFIWFLVDKYAK